MDEPRTLEELMDRVLLEMAANHPSLTPDQEAILKVRLFEIMADGEGWASDPEQMLRRFRSAADSVP